MGLIGGIIGGIGSAVAGIVGGNATRKAANRNAKILQEMENRNKAWYEQDYYGNYLERADAKAAINETRELLKERYKDAEGAAAVSGASEESLARQKAAANEVVADVTSNLAAAGENFKQQARENYQASQDAINEQKMGVNNQKAQATTQAASGLANAVGNLGDAVGGLGLDDKLGKLFKG